MKQAHGEAGLPDSDCLKDATVQHLLVGIPCGPNHHKASVNGSIEGNKKKETHFSIPKTMGFWCSLRHFWMRSSQGTWSRSCLVPTTMKRQVWTRVDL